MPERQHADTVLPDRIDMLARAVLYLARKWGPDEPVEDVQGVIEWARHVTLIDGEACGNVS